MLCPGADKLALNMVLTGTRCTDWQSVPRLFVLRDAKYLGCVLICLFYHDPCLIQVYLDHGNFHHVIFPLLEAPKNKQVEDRL